MEAESTAGTPETCLYRIPQRTKDAKGVIENMSNDVRLIAFDLDGTLTQHKTPLDEKNRAVLQRLAQRYRLLMIGAGSCTRIFHQMNDFPIDIAGNYGMQFAQWNAAAQRLELLRDECVPVDREEAVRRADALRARFGLFDYAGDTIEIHASGMLTFPLLGTKAALADKLACDPDRSRRKPMYETVKNAFPEYTVFIGGSSSFDIVPKPFCKSSALLRYLTDCGLRPENAVYCGDDYGIGGNDRDVYESDVRFLPIDNYLDFEKRIMESGLL